MMTNNYRTTTIVRAAELLRKVKMILITIAMIVPTIVIVAQMMIMIAAVIVQGKRNVYSETHAQGYRCLYLSVYPSVSLSVCRLCYVSCTLSLHRGRLSLLLLIYSILVLSLLFFLSL
jgi:hypothetical protein